MSLLFAHLSAEKARTYSLILASAGIRHTVAKQPGGWAITVAGRERHHAQKVVHLYLIENQSPRKNDAPFPKEALRPFSALGAALLILSVQMATTSDHHHQKMVAALGADARKILDGELYRCVSALLLHNGWPHLLSNMAAIIVFGMFTSALYGWGVSWLLILLSGALGNFLAAAWYGRFHLAVGASTAIFGAVGLCAAATFHRHLKAGSLNRRSWLPLAGGLALVGWLGTSPQSDLVAHFTGFISGLAIGGGYSWKIDRPLPGPLQAVALGIVTALIAGNWYLGMPD